MPRRFFAEARITLFVTSLYVFLEWLFFVTKSSFLSANSLLRNAQIGSNTAFLLSAAAVGACYVLHAIGRPIFRKQAFDLGALVPGFILSVLILLLVDNFTYTIFHWGIVNSSGVIRAVYGAGFLGMFFFLARAISRRWSRQSAEGPACCAPAFACFAASGVIAIATLLFADSGSQEIAFPSSLERTPNIVFFASDGVTADNLSVYGYARKTSPFLDSMRSKALIALAAVTNSDKTSSSTASMLNGFLPTTTHMLFPPQIFTGRFATFSLPAVLRHFGYVAMQQTLAYYADFEKMNMRGAFDFANGERKFDSLLDRLPIRIRNGFELEYIFLSQLSDRALERVLHVTGLQTMDNVYAAVKKRTSSVHMLQSDRERVNDSIDFIKQIDRPFFLHIHLMDTHCCSFPEEDRTFFGSNPSSREEHEQDLYDSMLLRVDGYFSEIIQALRDRELLDNTIVVYSSDHDAGWRVDKRVPLLFFFPHAQYAGEIQPTVQLLDVTPTILSYLGAEIPRELEGASLLNPQLPPMIRPVYTVASQNLALTGPEGVAETILGAENFGLKELMMTWCQRQYFLTMATDQIRVSDLKNVPAPCPENELPDEKRARELIHSHLRDRGLVLPHGQQK